MSPNAKESFVHRSVRFLRKRVKMLYDPLCVRFWKVCGVVLMICCGWSLTDAQTHSRGSNAPLRSVAASKLADSKRAGADGCSD